MNRQEKSDLKVLPGAKLFLKTQKNNKPLQEKFEKRLKISGKI